MADLRSRVGWGERPGGLVEFQPARQCYSTCMDMDQAAPSVDIYTLYVHVHTCTCMYTLLMYSMYCIYNVHVHVHVNCIFNCMHHGKIMGTRSPFSSTIKDTSTIIANPLPEYIPEYTMCRCNMYDITAE